MVAKVCSVEVASQRCSDEDNQDDQRAHGEGWKRGMILLRVEGMVDDETGDVGGESLQRISGELEMLG
jgi:hypothetical protein